MVFESGVGLIVDPLLQDVIFYLSIEYFNVFKNDGFNPLVVDYMPRMSFLAMGFFLELCP